MATDVAIPDGFEVEAAPPPSAGPDLAALERRHRLPSGLLSALVSAEGSGPNDVSPKGARGTFQFMPATAKVYGLNDPTDTNASADAAARYMADAMRWYGTDDPRVLAAEYNGGPRQAKAVLEGREPPATETRNYIKTVATKMAAANPPTLPDGFEVEPPQQAPARRTLGDILNGGPISASDSAGATGPQFDLSVTRSQAVINAAKLGLASAPFAGLVGNIEAGGQAVKQYVDKKLGIESGGTVDTIDKALGSFTPLGIIENSIKLGRAALGQEAKTAFPTSEELATKLLGYQKDMKPPDKTSQLLAEGTEFAASMAGNPAVSIIKGVLGKAGALTTAAKQAAEAVALSGAAVGGGQAAQAAFGGGDATKAGGELASIIPYAIVRKWFNPQMSMDAVKSIFSGDGGEIQGVFKRQAEEQLRKGIQEYPPSVANIQEATGLQQKINDALKDTDQAVSLSAGRASGAPRIIADELTARKSSNAAVSSALNADMQNSNALLSYMTADSAPGNTSRRMALMKVINEHNDGLAALQADEQAVKDQATKLTESIQPSMTPEQRGGKLVGLRVDEQTKENVVRDQLYGAARTEAQRVNAVFPSSTIEGVAAKMANDPILAYDSGNLPNVIRNIRSTLGADVQDESVQAMKIVSPDKAEQLRQRLAKLGDLREASTKRDNLSFDDIAAMKQAVNQDIAGELSSTNPNKRQRLRALTDMKNTIDGAIAESPYEGVSKLYGAANDYYKTTYAPKFNKGINAKLAMTDSFGQQRVLDENVLDQYMGSSNGANQFLTLFGKNPEAMAVMEDHLYDRFSQAAVKDGILDSRAARTFVGKNIDVLNKLKAGGLPTVDTLVNNGRAAQALADRASELTLQGQKLAKSDLTNALGTTEHGVIVEKALSDPYAMIKLTKAMDQEGAKALASSVLRDIGQKFTYTAESGKLGLNYPAFSKWLTDNQTSLKIMFRAAWGQQEGAEHLQRLLDANRMLAIQDRVPTVKLAESQSNIGKDPLAQRVGFSFRSFFNMFRAIKGGRTSEADAAVALGGQAGSFLMTKQYNELMQRIATDPESSKYLLTLAQDGGKKVLTGADVARQAKAISGALGKLGYIYAGGRYYGPSLRAVAPVLMQQQTQGVQ